MTLRLAVFFASKAWRRYGGVAVACVFYLVSVAAFGQTATKDRHSGYYYPTPQSQESYETRAPIIDRAGRTLRIGFVTGLTNKFLQRPFPPPFAIFAKGGEAEKLIIVGLEDGPLDTLYRARAVLANLTAVARLMPVFRESGAETVLTFFDLAGMLGFTQITVTNGRDFAHRIHLE